MKNTTKMFLILILAFIVVLFSVINVQQIDVNFLITKVTLPLALVLMSSVLIGALIVFIVMAGNLLKTKKQLKELKQKLIAKENQEESVENTEMMKLKEELREKNLELSDLKHHLVNDMMSDETLKVSNWADYLEEENQK